MARTPRCGQEPQEPRRRRRVGSVVERERDLAPPRPPPPPGERGQRALRPPGVGGPRRRRPARPCRPPRRRGCGSPAPQEREHLLGHGPSRLRAPQARGPSRRAPRGAPARPGARRDAAGAPDGCVRGGRRRPRPGPPRWPAPGPGSERCSRSGRPSASASAQVIAPAFDTTRSAAPITRAMSGTRPSTRNRGSRPCRARSVASSRAWSPQTAIATNGRSSLGQRLARLGDPSQQAAHPRGDEHDRHVGRQAQRRAQRRAVRRGGEGAVDRQPARDTRSGEIPWATTPARTPSVGTKYRSRPWWIHCGCAVKSVNTIPCGTDVLPRARSHAIAPAGVGWRCTTASGRSRSR